MMLSRLIHMKRKTHSQKHVMRSKGCSHHCKTATEAVLKVSQSEGTQRFGQ